MNTDFVNLTKENLSDEHLCCIIRSKKPHAGIDAKRQWLSDRLNEGHVFLKSATPFPKCYLHKEKWTFDS